VRAISIIHNQPRFHLQRRHTTLVLHCRRLSNRVLGFHLLLSFRDGLLLSWMNDAIIERIVYVEESWSWMLRRSYEGKSKAHDLLVVVLDAAAAVGVAEAATAAGALVATEETLLLVTVVLGVALAAEGTADAEEDGGDGPGSEGGPGEGNGLDAVLGRDAGVGEGAVTADDPGAVGKS
jgi:hypothetical protein